MSKAKDKPKGRGRPPKFDPAMCEKARKLLKLGALNKDIADFFGIDVRTFDRWQARYPEFKSAVEQGKMVPDDRVELSLLQRALGYSHPAEKIFMHEGKIVRAEYTEHYPPDTGAAAFWLKNRRPDAWRDRHHHEVGGANGGPIQVDIRTRTAQVMKDPVALQAASALYDRISGLEGAEAVIAPHENGHQNGHSNGSSRNGSRKH